MSAKIGANTAKARVLMNELSDKLNARFPGFWEEGPMGPEFVDLNAKNGFVRRPRLISVSPLFPYPDEGYRAICANLDPSNQKRLFSNFEELCEFIQSNIN